MLLTSLPFGEDNQKGNRGKACGGHYRTVVRSEFLEQNSWSKISLQGMITVPDTDIIPVWIHLLASAIAVCYRKRQHLNLTDLQWCKEFFWFGFAWPPPPNIYLELQQKRGKNCGRFFRVKIRWFIWLNTSEKKVVSGAVIGLTAKRRKGEENRKGH